MSQSTSPGASEVPPLLGADEPAPFAAVNLDGAAPFLLICDHASKRVPRALDGLGLDPASIERHIGWDIGAADAARWLSQYFDAPLLLAGYSRLVIDCNRTLDDWSSIPETSDGIAIPGNRSLDTEAVARRVEGLFLPYHGAIARRLQRWVEHGQVPALVSIHSFTPVFEGASRPWHMGILWDQDPRIAVPLLAGLRRNENLAIGDNEPYTARDPHGYSVPHHGAAKGYPHVAIEIRQDLIPTAAGAATWARHLALALEPILKQDALYRVRHYP